MSEISDALDTTGDAEPVSGRGRIPPTVATSHPEAVAAALSILEAGGNAIDAAIAATYVLGVVDPMSTGLGGDVMALVFRRDGRRVEGLDGSGAAPSSASIDALRALGHDSMPERGPLSITVPGAVSGLEALRERHGTLSLADLLARAIELAEEGFVVTPIVGKDWQRAELALREGHHTATTFLRNGVAPSAGERFLQPNLATTLRALSEEGADIFYRGPIGDAIAATVSSLGGWLAASDLATHEARWVEPVEASYRGFPVFELPPNSQGLVVLEALRILDDFPLGDVDEVQRHHLMIEAIKLAFADVGAQIGGAADAAAAALSRLDENHIETQRGLIGRSAVAGPSLAPWHGDTAYVAVVDAAGNACSLISSTYMHFGAHVVVPGRGIALHNRGSLFAARGDHPNGLAPGRRPFHTIIPAMVMRADHPWLLLGVVGGLMQPQGQVQILSSLIDRGFAAEQAVQSPRMRFLGGLRVAVEASFDESIAAGLAARDHQIERAVDDGIGAGGFGGAQVVEVDLERGLASGASDPRKDGSVGRLS